MTWGIAINNHLQPTCYVYSFCPWGNTSHWTLDWHTYSNWKFTFLTLFWEDLCFFFWLLFLLLLFLILVADAVVPVMLVLSPPLCADDQIFPGADPGLAEFARSYNGLVSCISEDVNRNGWAWSEKERPAALRVG